MCIGRALDGPCLRAPRRRICSDAFLSHGDQKPSGWAGNVKECFEFGCQAFDLTERLQTPVFVLTDLDWNEQLMSEAFDFLRNPQDRGKVLTKEDLDGWAALRRYRDVDGDAIGYRTLPGTMIRRRLLYARLRTQRRGRHTPRSRTYRRK